MTESLNDAYVLSTESKSINLQLSLSENDRADIQNAALEGQEVRFELVDTEYVSGKYTETSLPKMKRIDATVVELVKDSNDDANGHYIFAEGVGSTDNPDAFYRVKISVDSFDDIMTISAYLFTEPLIVTGNPKCNAIMMGGTNYAMYQIQTLSHTAKEICDAFGLGRDVYIRLENTMAIGNLANGSSLPDIKNIEARVVSAQKDMMYQSGYVVAYGTGYTNQYNQFYLVNLSITSTASVTAYLFKAYDANVATKTDVNNALKNVAYTNDIDELKAYVDEQLEDVGGSGGGGGVSDWNDLSNRPFYDNEDGSVGKQLDDKYLQMLEVGKAKVDNLPEQELSFQFEESTNYYYTNVMENDLSKALAAGEEYHIVWGDEEMVLTAEAVAINGLDAVYVGNTIFAGGEDNNVPFVVATFLNPEDTTTAVWVVYSVTEESKKVRVYHKEPSGYVVKQNYLPMDDILSNVNTLIDNYLYKALGGEF